jgi:hypothetical protein
VEGAECKDFVGLWMQQANEFGYSAGDGAHMRNNASALTPPHTSGKRRRNWTLQRAGLRFLATCTKQQEQPEA